MPKNSSEKKSKILIAEDEEFLIDAYTVKMQRENFDIVIARNGEEALKLVKEFHPDLILLDLIMPIMDGFQVLEKLQKDENDQKIPVIIASNLDQDASVKKGLALGAKDYYIKSNISINELVEKCRKYLSP